MRNRKIRVPIVEYDYLVKEGLDPLDYLTEEEVGNNMVLRKLFYIQHTEYPDEHIDAIAALNPARGG